MAVLNTNRNDDLLGDAIYKRALEIYPTEKNPLHYAPIINWELGGGDPLDGIDVYNGPNYYHFLTYGLSKFFASDEEKIEFTFKLKKENIDEKEIKNICGILQSLAKITFTTGEVFNELEYIYTGQKSGIDYERKSNITGFITILDPEFKTITTEEGRLKFVEIIGVSKKDIESLKAKKTTVLALYEKLGTDVTSFS